MRTISQYDARRYEDELESLREKMTDLLWWDEEGAMRRYFDLKGKAEKIEQILAFSVVEQEEHPKMRGKDPFTGRKYGASDPNDDQGAT